LALIPPDATCPSPSELLHQDLLFLTGPKSQCSSIPLGSSSTHSNTPSAISPCVSGDRDSRVREFSTHGIGPYFPEPRRSTVNNFYSGVSLSGNRRLWCRASHATQTPEPRNSDSTPPVLHLLWRPHSATSPPSLVRSGIAGSRLHRLQFPCITKPRTPILRCHLSTSPGEAYVSTPVSLSLYRDFAIREFAPPDAQGHRPCKTPNPDSSRSSTTCPPSDQRLRWTRGIAGRDFKEYRALTSGNAELRTPNQRDPTPRVPSPIDGSD
jgi:hypothetical protein